MTFIQKIPVLIVFCLLNLTSIEQHHVFRRIKWERNEVIVNLGGQRLNLTQLWIERIKEGRVKRQLENMEIGLKIKGAEIAFYAIDKTNDQRLDVEFDEKKIGEFQVILNSVRALRPKSLSSSGEVQTEHNPQQCPFCKNWKEERLVPFPVLINGREWEILLNIFPVEKEGHFLFIPTSSLLFHSKSVAQKLTLMHIEDMIELAKNSENLVLYFNGLGAGATQPHIHIHGVYSKEELPVEKMFREGAPILLREASGVKTWYLREWPATCLIFEGESTQNLATEVFSLVDIIQSQFRDRYALNVMWKNNKVYVFLRKKGKEIGIVRGKEIEIGAPELSGRFVVYDRELFETITSAELEEMTRSVSLENSETEGLLMRLINKLKKIYRSDINWSLFQPVFPTQAFLKLMLFIDNDPKGVIQEFLKECLDNNDGLGLAGLLTLCLISQSDQEIKEGINFIKVQRPYPTKIERTEKRGFNLVPKQVAYDVLRFIIIDKLAQVSKNVEGFKSNFIILKKWLNKEVPFYSHDIQEIWDLKYHEDGSISGSLLIAARGFLILGVGNMVIMNKIGVGMYLCHNFKSFFEKQYLGKEIIARVFRKGYQIGKLLGLVLPLAFAYYYLTDYELDTLIRMNKEFEETKLFVDLMNPLLNSIGMVHEREFNILAHFNDGFARKWMEFKQHYLIDGAWIAPLEEFVKEIDKNWWNWFYRNRILSFYN